MLSLARISTHRPRLILAVAVALGALAAVGTARIEKEEDLMVFLPTRDADVRRFEAVSQRFGALRVALVGAEVGEGHDVLETEPLREIAAASQAIRDVTGVDRVVSLTSITDVIAGADGAEVTPLVAGPPADAAAHAALLKKVMSRDHVVGAVISPDARAALLLVFLAEHGKGSVAGHVEDRIRQAATSAMPRLSLTFGGAPFAARAIYSEAQSDVWRLSPIALAILLIVVLLAFRDPVGVSLTIVSVGYAVLLVMGAMGWVGEHFTVATSTLPVILFASGSSYAVHVLGRYYLLLGAKVPVADAVSEPATARSAAAAASAVHLRSTAIQRAVSIVAPPLAIAALTTSAGFFSFIVTDVRPMRAFGIACGAGVLLCWLTSLTLVPAVITLWPRRQARPLQLGWLGEGMVRLWSACARHRWWVLGAFAVLVGAVLPFGLRVRVRMEPRAFFRPGSDPERAERFLIDRFGGATFLQVAVAGDLDEPANLRELARLEDYARAQPGVTQVQSIIAPLLLVSDAMGAGRRLPMTRGQSANLYFFLQGEPEVRSLLSEDRKEALVHVRLDGHVDEVVAALERYAGERVSGAHGWPSHDDVAEDMALILGSATRKPDRAKLRYVAERTRMPAPDDEELMRRLERVAHAAITAPDAPTLHIEHKAAAELAVERRSPGWRDTWRADALHPDDVDVAAGALEDALTDTTRALALERAVPALIDAAGVGDLPEAVRARVARSADDLFGAPAVAAAASLHAEVAGEPILDRGFSAAVARNQLVSLLVSIVLVFVFLLALFRSVLLAFICMAPAVVTLLCQMGAMGLSHTSIDLGTSLVAGIATGAGSDFAMHYLWYLRREDPDSVSRTIGPIMVLSVALVAIGFFVLGLGRSPVMHLFGGLAGSAMAISALLTCLFLPAALPRADRPEPDSA